MSQGCHDIFTCLDNEMLVFTKPWLRPNTNQNTSAFYFKSDLLQVMKTQRGISTRPFSIYTRLGDKIQGFLHFSQ